MKKSILFNLIFSQIGFLALLPIWLKLMKYLHPIVIGVVWFGFSSLELFCLCWIKKDQIQLPKWVLHVLAFLYSAGLLILLFIRPNEQSYENYNLIPFHTILFYLSGKVEFLIAFYNIAANICLFIPYGLYYKYIKNIIPLFNCL